MTTFSSKLNHYNYLYRYHFFLRYSLNNFYIVSFTILSFILFNYIFHACSHINYHTKRNRMNPVLKLHVILFIGTSIRYCRSNCRIFIFSKSLILTISKKIIDFIWTVKPRRKYDIWYLKIWKLYLKPNSYYFSRSSFNQRNVLYINYVLTHWSTSWTFIEHKAFHINHSFFPCLLAEQSLSYR